MEEHVYIMRTYVDVKELYDCCSHEDGWMYFGAVLNFEISMYYIFMYILLKKPLLRINILLFY